MTMTSEEICKLRHQIMGLEACGECPVRCSMANDHFNEICNITAANPASFPDVTQGSDDKNMERISPDSLPIVTETLMTMDEKNPRYMIKGAEKKMHLNEIVRNRLEMLRKENDLMMNQPEKTIKKIPATFESYEDAMKARIAIDNYEREKTTWEKWMKEIEEQLRQNEKDIIAKLPFRNVWVKVEIQNMANGASTQYGLGFHRDAWGGDHSVLDMEVWKEPMRTIPDTMQYN